MKLFFWKNNACFGRDNDGRILCKNANLIDNQNSGGLETLAKESLSENGEANRLVQELLEAKTS
ncbi:hypothetical protein IJU97_04335 [bacterium]|nr:hypothetical protein [bacterium]